jgi:ribose transport system permease protein
MKSTLSRLLADYGAVLVLLLLCACFSVLTYREQSPTGAAAGAQLARAITAEFGASPRVLVAVRDVPDDAALAEQLRLTLEPAGGRLLAVVKGEPKDARAALVKLAAAGDKLDVIACTSDTAAWLVFSDLQADFPTLGTPRIMTPQSYHWPDFLKADNLLNIASQIAVMAIIAIGMTMVVITGGIDLSVGSLVALSAVVSTKLIRDAAGGLDASPLGMALSCLAALVVCGCVGAASGAFFSRYEIPTFIITLAVLMISSGEAYVLSAGQSIYQIPDSFVWLGRGADLFGLPNSVVLMLVLYAAAHVLMSQTRMGRYLYAVGGNQEAARLSGVPVKRVILFAYIASGALAGLAGVIMASQLKSGSATYGGSYELYVIAAVVVGGAALEGGEGTMFGTLIGALTIAVIQNGMNLMNIDPYRQKTIFGAVLLAAVLINKIRRR